MTKPKTYVDAALDEKAEGPFRVIHHNDAKGTWYRVIDESAGNATIQTFRGQDVAHRYARRANSGWRATRRRARGNA